MEIPIIHETSKSKTSNKNNSSHSPFPHIGNDVIRNTSPTNTSPYGYSRSFSTPFTTSAASSSSLPKRQQSSYDEYKTDYPHDHSTHQRSEDFDTDFMNFKSLTANSDHLMMMSDDLSNFLSSNNNIEPQGFRTLHTRLPSTDSGIQADAGFDSLSRYKGKHLLSSTNAAAATAAVVATSTASSTASSDGGKSSEYVTDLSNFNQQTTLPSPSASRASPNSSTTHTHRTALSPQDVSCSSGYGSDIGFTSPTSSSSFSSSSPSPSSSVLSSPFPSSQMLATSSSLSSAPVSTNLLPYSKSMSLSKPVHESRPIEIQRCQPTPSSSSSSSSPFPPSSGPSFQSSNSNPATTAKTISRQSSVPAVAPKPRVSLSRKPAFLGRGGNSLKQPTHTLAGGGNGDRNRKDTSPKTASTTSPTESLSLSSGIKVIKKENGVEVRIPTKPALPPKNPQRKNDQHGNGQTDSDRSLSGNVIQQEGLNGIPVQSRSNSQNSSIDILSPDGSSVKIQVVNPGQQSYPSSTSTSAIFSSPLSSSAASSSPSSFSSSSTPSSTNSYPQTTTTTTNQSKQTPLPISTVNDDNHHLTRPLKLEMSTNAIKPVSTLSSSTIPPTSTNTSPTNSIPPTTTNTSSTPNSKWRSNTDTAALLNQLHFPTTKSMPRNPHVSSDQENIVSKECCPLKNNHQAPNTYSNQSSLSSNAYLSAKTEKPKTVHHIPIKTVNVSQSTPKSQPNSSLYSNLRTGASEYSNIRTGKPKKSDGSMADSSINHSKTTPISIVTKSPRNYDMKFGIGVNNSKPQTSSSTTSPTSVISSPPPAIVMSPPPSQKSPPSSSSTFSTSSSSSSASGTSKLPTSSLPNIDSCIFRFKGPDTSIFKQTFYDNNKSPNSPPSHSSSTSSSPQQLNHHQKLSPNSHQLLRPNYLPTTSSRVDLLKKSLKPGNSTNINNKTTGSFHSGVVLRRTDDIFKEALDFFNSRDDEDWDRLFSKSSFFEDCDDDMEKIFSKCWKTQDHDEFDKMFNKVFKRRKGSLDVDTRIGVSVDDDDISDNKDDNENNASKASNREELHARQEKTLLSKRCTSVDDEKSRNVTSSNGVKSANEAKPKGDMEKSKQEESRAGRSSSSSDSESWKETKRRMDTALSWLQHELADLRAMDKTIVSQFRRCQDTIESLQAQREVWEGLEEETEFWDDMEISEFNRRCQESPGSSSLSPVSTGSRDFTMATSDATWNAVRHGGNVIQDVEATL